MPSKSQLGRWLEGRKLYKDLEGGQQLSKVLEAADGLMAKLPDSTEAQRLEQVLIGLCVELEEMRTDGTAKVPKDVKERAATLVIQLKQAIKTASEDPASKTIIKEWAADPYGTLKQLVSNADDPVPKVFAARLREIEGMVKKAEKALASGDPAAARTLASTVYYACQGATTAVNGYLSDRPAFELRRAKVVKKIAGIRKKKTLYAVVKNQLPRLEKEVERIDGMALSDGYPAATAAFDGMTRLFAMIKQSEDAFRDFELASTRVKNALKEAARHAQASLVSAEIKRLLSGLERARQLGESENGGWTKTLPAMQVLEEQCAELDEMLKRLVGVADRLPDLNKALEKRSDIKKSDRKRIANLALKVMSEEGCSDEDALEMAIEAQGLVAEGMGEVDALVSARVMASLPSTVSKEKGREIGRNIRAGGSASIDDAKVLGLAMADLPEQVIKTFNRFGITTDCCREGVTEVLAESAGEHPRGWAADASWDNVPGMYSGSAKKVIIGTTDDGGNRKIPGPSEPPPTRKNKHGASSLLGHEAGHAFDAAEGRLKCNNGAFRAARLLDVQAGAIVGATNGIFPCEAHNYFLTTAERGTNDSGALSETFAESFAYFTQGINDRWPNLANFWANNPWGV